MPDQPAQKLRAAAGTALFLALLLFSGVRNGALMDFVLAAGFAVLLYLLGTTQTKFPRFLEPLARFGRESS